MTWTVIHGASEEVLTKLPANSIDAVVTDPPAWIGFMGKSWDKAEDYQRFITVMRECFRVLKPGAHMLVWAIPRTSHWTATGIEQAGFEIRDRVHHVFGSGMPHARDVSKAIDEKLLGGKDAARDARPIVGEYRVGGNAGLSTIEKGGTYGVGVGTAEAVTLTRTTGATPEAQARDGWHTNLKPGCEDWWLARKPLEGTLADTELAYGTGALNIDATRVPRNWDERGEAWKASGVSAKPEAEKIAAPPGQGMILHPGGGWPANLIMTHSAGCQVVGTKIGKRNVHEAPADGGDTTGVGRAGVGFNRKSHTIEEALPVWECEDECPVKSVDTQGMTEKGYNAGGVSRYFNVFYAPKAAAKEREAGCDALPVKTGGEVTGRVDGSKGLQNSHAGAGRGGGRRNYHPTVKSLALMRWLVKLITPPGGIVLDPFCGSGSTGCAAVLEGAEFLGIDGEAEYCEIARARITHWAGSK